MSRLGIDRESISTLSVQALEQPLQFNATERSAFIRSNIKQIRTMLTNGYDPETIKSIFPEFAEQYPGLLEMILRPGGFDERSLGLMINMLDKMGAGQTTQHEASIKVGQHLLDSYVTPQLDSAPGVPAHVQNQNQ
jgi:hypothetical protein